MVNFGEYLFSILQRNNLTISHIANKAKIDRTLLSKAISGSRTLNRNTFHKLLSVIETTEYENDKLTQLYAISYFGEARYSRIQILKNHLSGLFSDDFSVIPFPESNIAEASDTVAISDKSSILTAIFSVVSHELANASPVIYTNVPFGISEVDEILSGLILKSKSEADIKRIINVNKNNTKNDEIVFFVKSALYEHSGFDVRYFVSDYDDENVCNSFYPYFLITKKKLILFDISNHNGIIINDSVIIENRIRRFLNSFERCSKAVDLITDNTNLKEIILPYFSKSHEMLCITNDLSLFLTHKTFSLADASGFDLETNFRIREICDLNTKILSDIGSCNVILYKTAISDFIKTGCIYSSRNNTIVVPEENRAEFLKTVVDYVKNENLSFCITNNKLSNISENIKMSVFRSEALSESCLISNLFAPDISNGKSSFITTNDASFINTYCDFFEYISLFSYTESNNASIEYLENQADFTFIRA